MGEHTKGPWQIVNNIEDYLDIEADGERITSICLEVDDIAFEGGDDTPENEIKRRKANAELISKAWVLPDLLEAAEAIRTIASGVGELTRKSHVDQLNEIQGIAHNAIHKAKGGN